MGVAPSKRHRSPAERAARRHKRSLRRLEKTKKKQDEEAKTNALKAERDAWLRNYKTKGVERKLWHTGWWPLYEWWRERSAWEEELDRRRREGRVDSEGLPLRDHQD